MTTSIILIIITTVVGVIITLLGFIFRTHLSRIDKLEEVQDNCPVTVVVTDIARIKTDICWIKKKLDTKL